MTANTVYDVFLALPEMERQNLVALVKNYLAKQENKLSIKFKKVKAKSKVSLSKKEALDFLLKTVFVSKK